MSLDHNLHIRGVRVEQRLAQHIKVLRLVPLRGVASGGYLEQAAHFEYVNGVDDRGGLHQSYACGQRVRELLRAGMGDEAAASHTSGGDDEVLAGQETQGLTDRAAADATVSAQLWLRWEPVTQPELARRDL